MIIRIDGGALATKQGYGNKRVTQSLVSALSRYDTKNSYRIYRLGRVTTGWMKGTVTVKELIYVFQKGVFLALNQSLPLYTPGKIIALHHGLSFHHFPQLYPDSATKMEKQTRALVRRAQYILVSSSKIRDELIGDYHASAKQVVVAPFGIPHYFLQDTHRFKKKRFILAVGMNHPIKNFPLLLNAFSRIKKMSRFETYKLVLVGAQITHSPTDCILIPYASDQQLMKLYSEASCLVVTSKYESFHFPTVEALSCGTPVVATQGATIPELKKYVQQSNEDPASFAKKIMETIEKPPLINVHALRHQFTWETYVNTLTQLYEK